MTQPLDAVTAIHNAFRQDMSRIDAAALGLAQGKPGLAATLDRFRFFNEVLVWHANGEELAIFPLLETVAPLVAEAYIQDHRGLDAAFDALNEAVAAQDDLRTARASAAFKFHLDLHLGKEDAHVYRLIRERISVPDQAKALGVMSSSAPPDRFPEVVAWMFPLMGHDDRENMTRIWQMVMPAPVFAGAKQLIQKVVGDEWAELVRRIPTLLP
jgi:hemerythrin-like domain-containing protein